MDSGIKAVAIYDGRSDGKTLRGGTLDGGLRVLYPEWRPLSMDVDGIGAPDRVDTTKR